MPDVHVTCCDVGLKSLGKAGGSQLFSVSFNNRNRRASAEIDLNREASRAAVVRGWSSFRHSPTKFLDSPKMTPKGKDSPFLSAQGSSTLFLDCMSCADLGEDGLGEVFAAPSLNDECHSRTLSDAGAVPESGAFPSPLKQPPGAPLLRRAARNESVSPMSPIMFERVVSPWSLAPVRATEGGARVFVLSDIEKRHADARQAQESPGNSSPQFFAPGLSLLEELSLIHDGEVYDAVTGFLLNDPMPADPDKVAPGAPRMKLHRTCRNISPMTDKPVRLRTFPKTKEYVLSEIERSLSQSSQSSAHDSTEPLFLIHSTTERMLASPVLQILPKPCSNSPFEALFDLIGPPCGTAWANSHDTPWTVPFGYVLFAALVVVHIYFFGLLF